MAEDPGEIAKWQRLDERTTTSGRLTAEDIDRLDAIGVRHVVNLALADSPGALKDEAELLAARGIRYTHIPVPFDAPSDEHYAAFRRTIENEPGAVHVHCIMNYRVSAFYYRYNRQVRGMGEAEARALMEQQWSPETTDQQSEVWTAFIANAG